MRVQVDGCIVNQNDMYIYFECVNQIAPASVLDIGMFLKRIGAVSRQVMGAELPRAVRLDGIDFMEQTAVGVYRTIYDHIYSKEEALSRMCAAGASALNNHYEMAVMLGVNPFLKPQQEEVICRWLPEHVHYVLTDDAGTKKSLIQKGTVRDLQVGNRTYALITF